MFSAPDFEQIAVPSRARSSGIGLFFVWVGFQINTVMFFLGAEVMKGLSLAMTVAVLSMAAVVIASVAGLVGGLGARFGLSNSLIFRDLFGLRGALIPQWLQGLIQIGWFAVTVGITGLALGHLLDLEPFTTALATFVCGVVFASTAIRGYEALKKFSYINVPIVVLAFGAVSIDLFQRVNDWSAVFPSNAPDVSLQRSLTIAVGTFIAGATLAADLTRYASTTKTAVIASGASFLITIPLTLFVGGLAARVTGSPDLVTALAASGYGAFALCALVFANWSCADNAIYIAIVPLATATGIDRFKVGVFCALIGSLIAAAGGWLRLQEWLLFLGLVVPALAGPIIAEGWLLGRKLSAGVNVPVWRWSAFIAWAVGIGVGLLTSIPKFGYGIPPVNAILASMILHVLLARSSKSSETFYG